MHDKEWEDRIEKNTNQYNNHFKGLLKCEIRDSRVEWANNSLNGTVVRVGSIDGPIYVPDNECPKILSEDAKRLVAAWNACIDLSTFNLEDGIISRIIFSIEDFYSTLDSKNNKTVEEEQIHYICKTLLEEIKKQ